MKLLKEEKNILKSVENDEWESIPNFKQESKRYQEAARMTLRDNLLNENRRTKKLIKG